FLREYENAVDAANETLRSYPAHPWAHIWLASAFGQLGRREEAKDALMKAMALKTFDLSTHHRPPFMRPGDQEHKLEGLRTSGWNGCWSAACTRCEPSVTAGGAAPQSFFR